MGIYKEYRIRGVRVKYTLGENALDDNTRYSDEKPLLFGYAWYRAHGNYSTPIVETWANLSQEPDFKFKVMRPSNNQAENSIYASIKASKTELDWLQSGIPPVSIVSGSTYFAPQFITDLALHTADTGHLVFWVEYEFEMEYRESKI